MLTMMSVRFRLLAVLVMVGASARHGRPLPITVIHERKHPMRRQMLPLLALLGAAWGLTTWASQTSAAQAIVVSTTIQAAIDAARPGDTVVVPPGFNPEHVLAEKAYSTR